MFTIVQYDADVDDSKDTEEQTRSKLKKPHQHNPTSKSWGNQTERGFPAEHRCSLLNLIKSSPILSWFTIWTALLHCCNCKPEG